MNNMESFEERLYNHWIYTYNLYNIGGDISYDLRKQFGNDNVDEDPYDKGKYFTLTIKDPEILSQAINHFEYIRDQDENYYGDIKYKIEGDKMLFYIEI